MRVDIGISVLVAAIIALASIFMAASSQLPSDRNAKLHGDDHMPSGDAGAAALPKEEETALDRDSPPHEKKALLKKTTPDYASIERKVFKLVNEYRGSLDSSQLKWDLDLAAVASRHTTSMIVDGYFDHAAPSGFDVVDRYRLGKIACSLKVTNDSAESIYRSGEPVLEMAEQDIAGMIFEGLSKPFIKSPDAQYLGAGVSIDWKGELYATVNLC